MVGSGDISLNYDIMFIKAFVVNIGNHFFVYGRDYGCHNCN